MVGDVRGGEYEDKMVCWLLANGDAMAFEVLYWERPAPYVWELFGLYKAANYHEVSD